MHTQTRNDVTLRDEFEERLQTFQDGYSWHEQDEALRALAVTGELLELMFGPIEGALAMTALRAIVNRPLARKWRWSELDLAPLDRQWRETWSQLDGWEDASQPRFFDELHDLSAFARFGILPVWNFIGREGLNDPQGDMLRERLEASQDVPAWVESVCAQIDNLEQLTPRCGASVLNELLQARTVARARIKYDSGGALTVQELAALSGTSLKRLQNAIYAKADEAPVVDRQGLISPDSARLWLEARDHVPSIWKQVVAPWPLGEAWGRDVSYQAAEPIELVEDYVFVPVARDGTLFRPGLRRPARDSDDGGYTIGPKGSEQVVPSFDEALETLRSMVSPRWRRPNENNHWGIVVGQSWVRVRKSELEAL
jgi:hypothetical protein